MSRVRIAVLQCWAAADVGALRQGHTHSTVRAHSSKAEGLSVMRHEVLVTFSPCTARAIVEWKRVCQYPIEIVPYLQDTLAHGCHASRHDHGAGVASISERAGGKARSEQSPRMEKGSSCTTIL